MKRKNFLALLFLPLLLSVGCNSQSSSTTPLLEIHPEFSILCPKGAPAAAFSRYADKDFLELAGAQQVKAAFEKAEKDFIVFDSVNGLKLAKDNYLLVRMVTYGNLYVVSTGNDEDGVLDNDDTIYSYGEGLVPDMAFKAVHEGITPDYYGADVSATSVVMASGLYEGKPVDYVISSYPSIFPAMKTNTALNIYENVAEAFGKEFDTEGFPQAGLFIRKGLEGDKDKADAISAFLTYFDEDVKDLVEGGTEAVKNLNAYGTVDEQTDRFGFNANVLAGVQKENGLAFLLAEKNPTLEGFDVFKTEFDYPIKEELLSSFYPQK